MKQTKLNTDDLEWIKNHPKEFTHQFISQLNLVKNFVQLLKPYRDSGDKEGYNKRFQELLNKESEKYGFK